MPHFTMRYKTLSRLLLSCLIVSALPVFCAELPRCEPAEVGLDAAKLAVIDEEIEKEIANKLLPGCVVCIGRHGKIALLRAYGNTSFDAVFPDGKTSSEPIRADTIFDLASVTKPVATATSILVLADQGKLDVDAPVVRYLKEFDTPEKRTITVRQLLTHTAGFPQGPGRPFDDADEFKKRLLAMTPKTKPGEKYLYSCSSYIMLGEIVQRVSGKNLDEFAKEHIFKPLGMNDTSFVPKEPLLRRVAPVEDRGRGRVHDFQAAALGGVVGNAGLFSTADDLAIFMDMMLKQGQPEGKPRILETRTVLAMTQPNPAPPEARRGLGWTMQAGEKHRPKNMSVSAYGHGGYTGNAVWIDPKLDLFVIFLSNRPHRVVYPLASRIGAAAVAAVVDFE